MSRACMGLAAAENCRIHVDALRLGRAMFYRYSTFLLLFTSSNYIPLCEAEDSPKVDPDEVALEAAKVSVYSENRPKVCFACLGNDKLPTEMRTYSYYTSGDLSKHFKRKHLANFGEEKQVRCNLCQVDLDNKMHWQRHAYEVYASVSEQHIL